MTINEIMNTRLPKFKDKYKITDLKGLSAKCDMFIFRDQVIQKKENPKTIFITAYCGGIGVEYFIDNVLPLLNNTFNLIIGSEDYTFPYGIYDVRKKQYVHLEYKIFEILFKNEYLNKIFVENCDIIHKKCVPIPLGLLNTKNYFYKKYLNYYPLNLDKRKVKMFCCHRIHNDSGQFDERKDVSKLCLNNWKNFCVHYKELKQIEFLAMMRNSQFTICVHGGGIDTCPRLWEAMLVGSIPIVRSHPIMNKIYEEFPVIVIVKKWEEITFEKLELWIKQKKIYYENKIEREKMIEKLKLKYWWDKIKNI
jgi:hypothetical protein